MTTLSYSTFSSIHINLQIEYANFKHVANLTNKSQTFTAIKPQVGIQKYVLNWRN
jgi:hypothetical protein